MNRNDYFIARGYSVVSERFTERRSPSRAVVQVQVGNRLEKQAASGVGPVHALDNALRKCLRDAFPEMDHVRLADYRVSVVNADKNTAAKVHVSIRATYGDESWDAGCVSDDILDASFEALCATAVLGIMRIRTAQVTA